MCFSLREKQKYQDWRKLISYGLSYFFPIWPHIDKTSMDTLGVYEESAILQRELGIGRESEGINISEVSCCITIWPYPCQTQLNIAGQITAWTWWETSRIQPSYRQRERERDNVLSAMWNILSASNPIPFFREKNRVDTVGDYEKQPLYRERERERENVCVWERERARERARERESERERERMYWENLCKVKYSICIKPHPFFSERRTE